MSYCDCAFQGNFAAPCRECRVDSARQTLASESAPAPRRAANMTVDQAVALARGVIQGDCATVARLLELAHWVEDNFGDDRRFRALIDSRCTCGGPFSRSHNMRRGCVVHGTLP